MIKPTCGVLDHHIKFTPAGDSAVPLADIADRGWNILREDVMFPVAVLRRSALEHNSAWMHAFAARNGVELCPHGKTTMSPQLIAHQLESGAWGITAATAAHVRSYRAWGVSRVILANQLVGRQNIAYVLDELRAHPSFEFYCLVDSTAGLDLLLDALREAPIGRPLRLLLEVGYEGGRTGVRTASDAIELAAMIASAAPLVELHGVEAFEGSLPGRLAEDLEPRVAAHLAASTSIAMAIDARGWFAGERVMLTAGGSAFFDMVSESFRAVTFSRPSIVVLRSGCYLTHDSRHYAELIARLIARSPALVPSGEGPRAALEVWAPVQSLPEPDRAIVAMGKRDLSYDMDMPEVIAIRPRGERLPCAVGSGYSVFGLNDQHAYVRRPPGCRLAVGDLVSFGVSHPCTTFDKWRALLVVDDNYDVISAVETCF